MELAGRVILTGDRPTGPLHLGRYTGALASRVRLQSQCRTYVLIADLQALADNSDRPEIVSQAIWEVLLDFLEPVQGRRTEWKQRREELRDMLFSGTAQGRQVVTTTLRKALSAVGLPSAVDMQAV